MSIYTNYGGGMYSDATYAHLREPYPAEDSTTVFYQLARINKIATGILAGQQGSNTKKQTKEELMALYAAAIDRLF